MKIKNIRNNQKEIATQHPSIQDKKNTKEVVQEQSPDIMAENLSLKEQILTIQKAKSDLGLEILAAVDWDIKWGSGPLFEGSQQQRFDAAIALGKKDYPTWKDFTTLISAICSESQVHDDKERIFFTKTRRGAASVVKAITWSMVEIANKLQPGEINLREDFNLFWCRDGSYSHLYHQSAYNGLALCPKEYIHSSETYTNFHDEYTRSRLSEALRIVFRKAGEQLNAWKQAVFLQILILYGGVKFTYPECMQEGILAAEETYKREWRKEIYYTGFIKALEELEDDNLRERIAWVIAKANPATILEVHAPKCIDCSNEFTAHHQESNPHYGSDFYPLKLLFTDRSSKVREALLSGIEDLCLAQKEMGWYYGNFSEKPELSPQNRIDIFTCTLNILEQFNSSSYLQEYQAKMLNCCCNIISYLVSDEAITYIKSNGKNEQNNEYAKLINRLSQIDLIKFVKLTSHTEFDDPNWKDINIWNNASQTIDRILLSRAKTYENPLNHYFELQKEISKMKNESPSTNVTSRLVNALEKIDNAVEHCLREKTVQDIKWGTSLEFNTTVASLIELLKRSQQSSRKLAIMNLFEALNTEGLSLSEQRKVNLDKALNESNKSKLRQALKTMIYSTSVNQKLFFNPQTSTPRGKALLIYRAYKSDSPPYKSFKDYYGMNDLKQYALSSAIEVVISKRASKGLLLSGEPGTGKSMFASVLANELALPLIVVKSSEVANLSRYLDDIKNTGCCVVLVDEIERIAKPSNMDARILGFFKALQKLPVITIATTNSPATDTIEGMAINKDGTSAAINKVLVQNVHPDCLKTMRPCYFFHRNSVGSDFTKQYLEQLIKMKRGKESNIENLGFISTLGKGLTPFDIMTAINQEVGSSLEPTKIISTLGKLQLGRPRILTRAKEIKQVTSNLEFEEALKVRGKLDFKKLAFVSEDISIDRIEEIVSGCTTEIDQDSLLALFCKHSGLDAGVLRVLKRV